MSKRKIGTLIALCTAIVLVAGTLPALAQAKLKDMTPEERDRLLAKRKTRVFEPSEPIAEVPSDAKRTASGMAYKVIEPGDGDNPPGSNDLVILHHTGWTPGGYMFDTTRNGTPQQYQVNRLPSGLEEGVRLLVEGRKVLVWIPDELVAQTPRGTETADMVVYELELLDIFPAPPPPESLGPPPAGSKRLESGMAYQILQSGRGSQTPKSDDRITFHYSGWTQEGELVGSSKRVEAPETVVMNRAEAGLAEAMEAMTMGEIRRVWMPRSQARRIVGERAKGTVIFDLELVSLFPKPQAPPDVAEIPSDAVRTPSGLATKVIVPGVGDRHPSPEAKVVVDYAAWSAEGDLIDSSFDLRQPTGVQLGRHMPDGWNEALQLMVPGERRMIWIPEELWFQGGENQDRGMVIFDVTLLAIPEDPETSAP